VKRPGLWGFARATVVFMLVRPMTAPFLRPINMLRQALALVKNVPTIAPQSSSGEEADRQALREEMIPLRRVSRRWALIFMLLSVGIWGWWLGHIVLGRWALVSLASLETLLLCGAIGLQCLVQCYTNWRARGHEGGFGAFLSDGQNVWPR